MMKKTRLLTLSIIGLLFITILPVAIKGLIKNEVIALEDIDLRVGEEINFEEYFFPYVTEKEKVALTYEIGNNELVYVNESEYKILGLKAGTTEITVESSVYKSTIEVNIKKEDVMTNGDFENLEVGEHWSAQNDTFEGWRLYTGNSAVNKEVQKIEVAQEDDNKFIRYSHSEQAYSALYTEFAIESGEYYVEVDMKTENVEKDVYVRVNQGRANGASNTTKIKGTVDKWTTYQSDVVRLERGETFKLELYFALNSGVVCFDNIRIYRVITTNYTAFNAEKDFETLEEGQKLQLKLSTNPTTIIPFNFDFSSTNNDIVTVDRKGIVTAVSNGIAEIKITDKLLNTSKYVKFVVGVKDGISATFNNNELFEMNEDTTAKFSIDVEGTDNYEIYKYTNPANSKYYIQNNEIVFNPNKDFYSLTKDDFESFEVIVFDEEKGFCITTINVYVNGIDDAPVMVDYWHTTDKNQSIVWGDDPTTLKAPHSSLGRYNGGYVEVTCADIEVLYPQTAHTLMTADELAKKTELYKTINAKSLNGTLTLTTENGGTVTIIEGGVAQRVEDRYAPSVARVTYGILYEYTPPKDYIGYDTFSFNVYSGEEVTEFVNTIYIAPGYDDFKFDQLDFDGVYLLTNGEWLNDVYRGYEANDPYITKWVKHYENQLSNFTATAVPASARGYLEQFAILYQVTGKKQYLDNCLEQLRAICNTNRSNWGKDSNGFLDAAMVTYSVSFAYNFIKDDISDENKVMILTALYEEGFYYFKTLANVNVLLHGNNHNLLVASNLAIAALSAMSYDGDLNVIINGKAEVVNIREESQEAFKDALKYLQVALVHYSPSGGFPEGPAYSYYAHRNLIGLMASLDTLYGRDYNGNINSFGLSEVPGVMNYVNYPLYSSSPNYEAFYYAEASYSNNQPGLLWYTRYDEKNFNAAVLSKLADNNDQYNILNLLWYKPGLFEQVDLQAIEELDYLLEDHELATFRDSFDNEYGMFAGLKGVETNSDVFTHKNLDSGTFELYALGEKFIGNYSDESYNVNVPPGFWDYSYQRWTYYKKAPQGQNTLVINPENNPVLQQDPFENAPITRFESNNSSGLAMVDLTGVYKSEALHVQRGLMMHDNKTKMTIQDEFILRDYSTLYWSAHTAGNIEIISEKLAKITINGKVMYVQITSELGEFTKMSGNTPLPGTVGEFYNDNNDGITKLVIKLENILEGTLKVVFTPSLEEVESIENDVVTPLKDWKLEEKVEKSNIVVNDINFDTKFGDGYKYTFNPYQYKYVVNLQSGITNVPEFNVEYDKDKYEVSIEKSNLLNDVSRVIVTDKATKKTQTYEYKFVVDSITDLSTYESYTKVNVEKVHGTEGAEKLINDGTNRFSSQVKEEVIFEFATTSTITNVNIRFNGGLLNKYYFDVLYSLDGVNFEYCYLGGQSTGKMGNEVFTLGTVEARFIKIVFNGNNNDHNLGSASDTSVNVSNVSFYDNGTRVVTDSGVNPILLISIGVGAVIISAVSVVLILKKKKGDE